MDNLVKEGSKTYEDLIKVLPGFEDLRATKKLRWNELKRITIQTHGGINRLVEKHHPVTKKDYYQDAIRLIKENGRSYTSKKLCIELGFINDFGYKLSSLEKNSDRYLRQHIGLSFRELQKEAFNVRDKSL